MKKNPAVTLGKKLVADRNKVLKSISKLDKVLLDTTAIIGGYNMIRKLTRHKNLLNELAKVMQERIEIFQSVVDKTK